MQNHPRRIGPRRQICQISSWQRTRRGFQNVAGNKLGNRTDGLPRWIQSSPNGQIPSQTFLEGPATQDRTRWPNKATGYHRGMRPSFRFDNQFRRRPAVDATKVNLALQHWHHHRAFQAPPFRQITSKARGNHACQPIGRAATRHPQMAQSGNRGAHKVTRPQGSPHFNHDLWLPDCPLRLKMGGRTAIPRLSNPWRTAVANATAPGVSPCTHRVSIPKSICRKACSSASEGS